MMEDFFSKEECLERIRELISQNSDGVGSNGLREAIATAVANSLGDQIGRAADEAHADALELKIGRWTLRDEDINLFPVINGVITFVVTLSMAGGLLGAGAGLAVSTVQLLWIAHRKGALISEDQAKMLTLLRSDRQPKDAATLASKLGGDWTPDRIKALLKDLGGVPARGGLVKLAEEMPDGRWIAAA